jgi:tyrosinase
VTVVATQPAQLAVQTPLSFRKNAMVLRSGQLAAFRRAAAASMAIGDDRGWQHWAGLHGLPLPMYCQHHTPLFLPWHRAYLYYLELTLKEFEITASLPWWDWSSPRSHSEGLPAAYTAQTGADGQPNPLAGTDINDLARRQGGPDSPPSTFRNPDAPNRLPTTGDVQQLLALGDFLDFQQQLEQVHDSIHVWVGATMAEIPFAAYDPIFFAHHAMVDRLWRLWQLRHPTAALPGSLLDEALPPFNITVRQTLSVTALGYDYASFSSRASVAG